MSRVPSGVHRSADLFGAKNSASLCAGRARPRVDRRRARACRFGPIRSRSLKNAMCRPSGEYTGAVSSAADRPREGSRSSSRVEEIELLAVGRGQIAVDVLLEVQPIDHDRGFRLSAGLRASLARHYGNHQRAAVRRPGVFRDIAADAFGELAPRRRGGPADRAATCRRPCAPTESDIAAVGAEFRIRGRFSPAAVSSRSAVPWKSVIHTALLRSSDSRSDRSTV